GRRLPRLRGRLRAGSPWPRRSGRPRRQDPRPAGLTADIRPSVPRSTLARWALRRAPRGGTSPRPFVPSAHDASNLLLGVLCVFPWRLCENLRPFPWRLCENLRLFPSSPVSPYTTPWEAVHDGDRQRQGGARSFPAAPARPAQGPRTTRRARSLVL